MKKLLVSLYSAYLDAYDEPTLTQYQLADLKTVYTRTILCDPEGAWRARAQEKTVVVLGEFDDCNGHLEAYPEPKKLFELAPLFPKGFIMNKEAKSNA